MDRFDRVACYLLSSGAVGGGMLLLSRFHSWKDAAMIFCVTALLARYPWISIPQETRRIKIAASICGDNSGPEDCFCVLEPGHPRDHKHFHSSGGMIGWPRKGGA